MAVARHAGGKLLAARWHSAAAKAAAGEWVQKGTARITRLLLFEPLSHRGVGRQVPPSWALRQADKGGEGRVAWLEDEGGRDRASSGVGGSDDETRDHQSTSSVVARALQGGYATAGRVRRGRQHHEFSSACISRADAAAAKPLADPAALPTASPAPLAACRAASVRLPPLAPAAAVAAARPSCAAAEPAVVAAC